MRRPSLRVLLGTGIPLLVVLLLLGAWAFDTSAAAGGSIRNIELAGRDVGGLDEDAIAEVVDQVADEFADRPVEIDTGEGVLEATAAELSLEVDRAATVAAVLEEGREGNLALRPLAWLRSFVSPYEVEVRYQVRRDRLALALASREDEEIRTPVEPAIVASPEMVSVRNGRAGRSLDPVTVAERLVDAAVRGEDPLTIRAEPVAQAPQVSDEDATALATEATELTSEPLVATVEGRTATFDVPELRAWIGSRITEAGMELTVDEQRIAVVLRDQIGSLGDETPQDARFTVEGGQVRIIPAVIGRSCCAEGSETQIAEALLAGQRQVEVQAQLDEPELTTEAAEALNIREPVGTTTEWNGQVQDRSFTTYHACCEARVRNIQLIADMVRGALVLPGESFSINDHVGPRTADKGFVEAGAIANGELVQEIGGGVSQFATTMFNAVFFAGLPFDAYQAHSQYFSRYPYGREATMGHPNPDLRFTNNTPHGILIWTSYTDTSITVTLYSTQHAFGQQTGQTESRSGSSCTSVTTTRTITYVDGRTATDTVGARYRDSGARTCDG